MPELSAHDWLEIIGLAFTIGIFVAGVRGLRFDVDGVKEELKKLNNVILRLALSEQRQGNFEEATNERFRRLETLLTDLQHGRGMIRD